MGMSSMIKEKMNNQKRKKTFKHLTELCIKLELFNKLIWWHIKLIKVEIFRWLTS